MTNRLPPADIRRNLRREVGFGCPVNGCRSPFLEYHHFDPPWNEGLAHIESGMIALCPSHHAMADSGAWIKEDLRNMKQETTRPPVKGRINWNLANSVLIAGKNYFFGNTISLRLMDYEVFGLHQDSEGRLFVNALFWDSNLNAVLQIQENDILINNLASGDFSCTASGNKLRVESRFSNTYFEIEMHRAKTSRVFKGLPNDLKEEWMLALLKEREDDGQVLVLTLKAKIITSRLMVQIQDNAIRMDFRKYGYDNATLRDRVFHNLASLRIIFGEKEFIYLGR